MNQPHETPSVAASRQILIVDDEQLIRDVLVRWLCAEGFACVTAADVESAWEALQQHSLDLVLCDLNMPGSSGMTLLERLAPNCPDLTVLMLTGCGDTATAIRALTHGASGYLLKPVQRDELVCQVRQGLERTQLRRDRRRYTEELERRVREQTQVIRTAHEETIHRLMVASCYRDEETGAHIRRTGLFSEVLARAAKWSDSECDRLRMAAPMHDVGKIGIPDAILRKPGRLTAAEFEMMKQHTTIGARMLEGSSSSFLALACEIAQSHHERWDGAGYPHRLAGEAIPEAARIVAIVDVYDALTHDRVYRPALPEPEVLDILRDGQGTHFDPGLLGLFFSVLEEIRDIAAVNPDETGDALAAASLGANYAVAPL